MTRINTNNVLKTQRAEFSPRIPKSRVDTSLPAFTLPQELWTNLLPPCLGFYKSEYTVSYGYGFATALTALSILRRSGPANGNGLLPFHAGALIFYGFRLNLFLFVRTALSSRMQEFNNNIEERAVTKGNRFKTRAPFVLSCALLYYGLSAPLLFTSKMAEIPLWTNQVLKALIGLQWYGFAMAALGDFTKTFVKRAEKDEHFLVTTGIFSLVRHPNYTGEIIGWTANILCGLIASCFIFKSSKITPALLGNLAASALGWVGILFVLLRASANLEERQKKEYGNDPKYEKWINSSWSGWQLPAKEVQEEEHEEPHLEVSEENEEFGSGI